MEQLLVSINQLLAYISAYFTKTDEEATLVSYATVATTTTTYMGYCGLGSSAATSSAIWKIKRIVEDTSTGSISITYADGNRAYDNVWADRASLSYS